MSDPLNDACKRVLALFGRLPTDGFVHLRNKLNPTSVRGVYAFESSFDETLELERIVHKSGSLASIIDCIKFYDAPSKRAIAIGEQVNDSAFADAVNTHTVRDTTIVAVWVYRGGNATTDAREREDFGVMWAAISLVS